MPKGTPAIYDNTDKPILSICLRGPAPSSKCLESDVTVNGKQLRCGCKFIDKWLCNYKCPANSSSNVFAISFSIYTLIPLFNILLYFLHRLLPPFLDSRF